MRKNKSDKIRVWVPLAKLNLQYSMYQRLLFKKNPKDAPNCGKSALHIQSWATILNSWFPGAPPSPLFTKNWWQVVSLEMWPHMNCSQMLQHNQLLGFFLSFFFSETAVITFVRFCSWKPIVFCTQDKTHRQTGLPLCSVCFPPESTPLGSIPVGVKPFSVSTLSLSSLQRLKKKWKIISKEMSFLKTEDMF